MYFNFCTYDSFIIEPDSHGIGLRFSNNLPNGYFVSCVQELYPNELKQFFPINKNEDEDAQKARHEKELKIFQKIYCTKNLNDDYLISDFPNDHDLLLQTWIPKFCINKHGFLKCVYELLTNKYAEKKNNLASILFR